MLLEGVPNVMFKELEKLVAHNLWHGFVLLSLSEWFYEVCGEKTLMVKFFVLCNEGLH